MWLKGFQMTWKLLTRLDMAPNREFGGWGWVQLFCLFSKSKWINDIIFPRLLWASRCFPLPLFPYLLPLSRQDSTNDNHHLSMAWPKLETDYTIVQYFKPLFLIYSNPPPYLSKSKLDLYCTFIAYRIPR